GRVVLLAKDGASGRGPSLARRVDLALGADLARDLTGYDEVCREADGSPLCAPAGSEVAYLLHDVRFGRQGRQRKSCLVHDRRFEWGIPHRGGLPPPRG